MATKKAQNIYEKIMTARLQFLESNPKKSGKNEFQKFSYYELDDIVPTATRICNELGLYTEIDMGAVCFGYATLTVVNIDNPDEKVYFRIKMPEITNTNVNKALQETGSSQTYLRRYLYLQFLDIAQNDEVDSKDSRPAKTTETKKPVTKPRKPSSPSPRKQPSTTNKRLTLKQKKDLKELDETLEKIITNHPNTNALTMKNIFDELQSLQDNNEITEEERVQISKKISTI